MYELLNKYISEKNITIPTIQTILHLKHLLINGEIVINQVAKLRLIHLVE